MTTHVYLHLKLRLSTQGASTCLWEDFMDARTSEIADGIYRISVFVPQIAEPAGFTFNHFLVLGDEPLLFHTGLRRMFPTVRDAVARIMAPERLRWISFGHYEADECGR
jgi:flavorubredoxin